MTTFAERFRQRFGIVRLDKKPNRAFEPTPRPDPTRRFSSIPRVQTTFEPEQCLGVLESPSPQTTASPATPYSGVAKISVVDIVRRLSKGKVKNVELQGGEVVRRSVGTQTEEVDLVRRAKERGLSGAPAFVPNLNGTLYSVGAGVLFQTTANDPPSTPQSDSIFLILTDDLLRHLRQAIASSNKYQALQERTARERSLLTAHQDRLRLQLQQLKERLELSKRSSTSDPIHPAELDKAIVKVWEALAGATDQAGKIEDRLDDARDEWEKFAQAALVALAGALGREG